MSRIFIDRPIFAWVIAIIVMLVGIISITRLPVAQYPDIAPPQVNINATYPGASADTLQNSVTQVLEQQLTGLDGLLYFSSSSSASGSVTINAVFDKGVDPDIAQVQVQNAIQAAISPPAATGTAAGRAGNQVQSRPLDDHRRLRHDRPGNERRRRRLAGEQSPVPDRPLAGRRQRQRVRIAVRDADLAGSERSSGRSACSPSDVITAIQAQNVQVAAGEIGGQPQPETQMLDATVTAQSRLADARPVSRHCRQERSVRSPRHGRRRRARRARRRELLDSYPRQWPSGRRNGHQSHARRRRAQDGANR